MSGGLLWAGLRPLLLASSSETRRKLLTDAGLSVAWEAPGVDERALTAGFRTKNPGEVAAALARAKALAVSARHPDDVVIGADQVLSCEGELFSKAPDPDEACAQLARLAGRAHELHSAVAIARAGQLVAAFGDTARLTMRALDRGAIQRYVTFTGPAATRSVGCYEVEALGIHLFERVEGDHTTILGLPMLPLLAELRRLNLLAL